MSTNEGKRGAIETSLVANEHGKVGGLRLTFSNGNVLELRASQLTDVIMEAAIWHGLKQKLVDAAAISRDPETGKTATIETKYAAVKEVYDRLLAGEWNKRREGGAGGTGGLLYRALVRMYAGARTPEQIKAFLAGKDAAAQAILRKSPKIAVIIEEIKAEDAEGWDDAPDADELLAGL